MGAALSSVIQSRANESILQADPRNSLLHSIYEPDRDLRHLHPRELKLYLEWYHMQDCTNTSPRAAPPYSEAEQSALELWRQQVNRRMMIRISSYNVSKFIPEGMSKVPQVSRPPIRSEHPVFQIPEMLDLILHFSGPQAQVRALQISAAWRTSAISVITNRRIQEAFLSPSTAPVIEYGQLIDDAAYVLPRPCTRQIEQFGLHVNRMISWRNKSYYPNYIYFPACMAQLSDLPSSTASSLNELDIGQRSIDYHDNTFSVSRDTDLFWLDFTQLQINPYFDLLFSEKGRLLQRLGRWEISLRPDATPGHLVVGNSPSDMLLVHAIGSMHITNPPCRCVGIYCYDAVVFGACGGAPALLKRIRNNDGICVGELLDALEDCAPKLLGKWAENAEQLRNRVTENGHWIDDVWRMPGTPRFRLHLDNYDMPDEMLRIKDTTTPTGGRDPESVASTFLGLQFHITRTAYMSAEPPRATTEGEWLPEELFEPMKTETGRSNVDWEV
ncbi:uncharacterized protein J4E92_007256 [Alternaria infectoria]|uniref:uncharacterized protein n=1 Tax=Alternaria infectoria TaxID=45303 RepID=UPI00221F4C2C|nr:uncharacterized protein J4E92_007256 [Alternaria infectoria]KAI4924175.1 hypothetical protein J4E92_007256 [Alternaria infectoria]